MPCQAGIDFLLLAGARDEALQAALKHGLLGTFLDHLGAGQAPLGCSCLGCRFIGGPDTSKGQGQPHCMQLESMALYICAC